MPCTAILSQYRISNHKNWCSGVQYVRATINTAFTPPGLMNQTLKMAPPPCMIHAHHLSTATLRLHHQQLPNYRILTFPIGRGGGFASILKSVESCEPYPPCQALLHPTRRHTLPIFKLSAVVAGNCTECATPSTRCFA